VKSAGPGWEQAKEETTWPVNNIETVPDAIILCGGAGTRLKSITADVPKSMALVNGRPFLELLMQQLRRHGIERVILAVGYGRDIIRAHFGSMAFGLTVLYSEETEPLGTGGALHNAADLVTTPAALILNGDSYTDAPLPELAAEHRKTGAEATVVVVPVDGRSDTGSVSVGRTGAIEAFQEKKQDAAARFSNAGIYMIRKELLREIPAGIQVSLERELFPQWLTAGRRLMAMVWRGKCFDIGTPDRYWTAQGVLADVEGERIKMDRGNCK
jgi:NDP-sugar pyrophosphorylase family protein